jgi:RimJ/RimL family protein N-acetyltransferase
MLKAKDVCLAKNVNRIKWQVEQGNHGAIKIYQRLGANMDIKGIFQWDISS